MKVSEINNLSTAQHYHSTITNVIIGFSGVIGIGITLVWSSKGDIWRTNNIILLTILLTYFVPVMNFVFLKDLRDKIATLDRKKKRRKE